MALPRSWKEEFERAARVRRDELRRDEEARFDRRDRDRRERQERQEQQEDNADLTAIEMILATSDDIAAFHVELDDYDTATVAALMENSEALEAVQQRIDDMLIQAYVLPDGRRVFKTTDGSRVFDEYGQELSPEVIDPAAIDDSKPKWEAFSDATDEHADLTQERQELLDYQTKLDAARDRVDGDDITKDELDDLKADLAEAMPDAVRAQLDPADADKPDAAPPKTNLAAMPDDMDTLMRQTGLGPAGPGL